MPWYLIIGIYVLIWTFALFLVLPFGIRSADEAGARELYGQQHGAPHQPRMMRKVMWTTIIATLAFGLFMLNAWQGWLTVTDINNWMPAGLD